MVGKVLKRSEVGKPYSLPPRLFREVLDPNRGAPFNRDLLAYDQEQFYRKDTPKRVYGHCIGHFWDNGKKQAVEVDLGPVNVICRKNVYRAASSAVLSSEFDDEPANVLSWGEGAAPCTFAADEYRPERSEDGTESAETVVDKYQYGESGSYVIPGQTPMDRNNFQKTGGQTPTDGNNQC